jgi:hypothetical protein
MADSGFKYFIEYMQARNAPPKPKSIPVHTLTKSVPIHTVPASTPYKPPPQNEDYTGSVCLLHSLTDLFPGYLEVLVDADDMDRLSAFRWHIVRSKRESGLRVMNTRGRFLHTVVMSTPKGAVVDHRFHQTLDNRKCQLRIATVRENNINRRPRVSKSVKYKGIQQSKKTGKWFVHAGPRGARVFISGFDSEIEAARAYNELARRLYGSIAYQNPV